MSFLRSVSARMATMIGLAPTILSALCAAAIFASVGTASAAEPSIAANPSPVPATKDVPLRNIADRVGTRILARVEARNPVLAAIKSGGQIGEGGKTAGAIGAAIGGLPHAAGPGGGRVDPQVIKIALPGIATVGPAAIGPAVIAGPRPYLDLMGDGLIAMSITPRLIAIAETRPGAGKVLINAGVDHILGLGDTAASSTVSSIHGPAVSIDAEGTVQSGGLKPVVVASDHGAATQRIAGGGSGPWNASEMFMNQGNEALW